MKKLLLTLSFFGLTTAFTNALTSFNSTAGIMSDILITESTPLNFGTIKPAGIGSTTIDANITSGIVSVSGGLGDLVSPGTVGVVSINGNDSSSVRITVLPSATLKAVSGATTLTVFWSNNASSIHTLNVNGFASFKIGGILLVPVNATPTGAYSGTYTVSAIYL